MNEKVSAAMVAAQKAFGPALKTSTNPHYKSRYADLSACVEAVIGGLNENGIALIQLNHECNDGVIVETLFLHESGESISAGKLHVPAQQQNPQGYGSALTYARRYGLMSACGIAPEDDDGNAASVKDKKKATPEPLKVDQPPPPTVEQATDTQRKELFAKAMARWDSRTKSKDFADWLLKADNCSAFTSKYITECIKNFDTLAEQFEKAS